MSEGNSTNSWTILTPEETAAETLRPLAEGTQHHEESTTSTAGHTDCRVEGALSAAERLSVEDQQVSEDKTPAPSEDTSTGPDNHPTFTPTAVSDVRPPSPLDVPGQSEGLSEVPAQSSPDPDSFSDSYTHISPSPDEPPASLLTTETLGAVGLTQEEPTQEGTLHPLNGEELGQEREESELSQSLTDFGKQADSPVDSEVVEERIEEKGEEGETEERRRSLLAALERIGRREEEEEEEEEFQLPQQKEDSGFSVNKCILGAVFLLGLGTILFSGVFMDLNEESDYGAKELRDAEVPVKQDWLNPEVPPTVDVDNTELLNKLAKGNEQISVLLAQFQAQKEELKVAKGQAAEGAKERLQREEVERENGRLKKEMASLPVLQKENEKMKRELESVPALQKELETLRVTVAELKLSTANEGAPAPVGPTAPPPPGQAGDSMQGTAGTTERQARKSWEGEKVEKKKDKYDMGEKKEWKEREKFEGKEGEKKRKDEGKMERKEKEWKKGKHEQGKYDQEKGKEGKQWRQNEEKKEWKERGDWKKDKASRGDEGKPWKDREGKKEWKEKSERKEWKEKGEKKEWKEEKDWKKGKQEKWNDGKESRGKDEKKERKGGKDHGEWHKDKEEWKGEKEWKKGKDGFKESGKDWKGKLEKKDGKEKGDKNEWKKDSDWKSKNGKDHGKERKGKDERKQMGKKESKEGEWKREGLKEERSNGDWKKDSFHKHKDESKYNKLENHDHHHDNHKEHLWQGPGDRKPPHTHRQPSLEQPDYWVHQREKLQHNPSPPHYCDSVETCAQAEGLLPVPLPEFEAILQGYLAKAEGVGVDASKREELSKLATEFFKDGVFVHDQMSFQDFVEDVEDILEDMVEGEEGGGGEDDSIEEEMDGFEGEVMSKFSVQGAGQREERKKGEWRKESGRGRG